MQTSDTNQFRKFVPTTSRKSQIVAVWALVISLCLLLPVAGARAQTIVRSFDGDSGPGLEVCQSGVTHCGVPEMNVAANGKQVVQVTWQNVRVYDYDGHLVQSAPMTAFISHAGLDPVPTHTGPRTPGPFEPHVVYDEFIGRWLITVTGKNDSFLVSASSDATGAWGGVYLSCLQGGPCLSNDPGIKLGYDKNGVYLCAAHPGDDNPNTPKGGGWDCFAVPPSQVQAIAQGTPPENINRGHNMPVDPVPEIDHNPHKAASAPAFILAKSCAREPVSACKNSPSFSFQWLVNTFTWNGVSGSYNAGGGQQAVKTGIGSTENKWIYNTPLDMAQAGSDIMLRGSASHRFMNVVQSGSHLHGVMGSGPCTGSSCGSQGTDTSNLMLWVDLDCTKPAACVVSQTAKISGGTFNPVFGTIGVDAKGNLGIVAESSGPSTDLSLLLWTRRKADPANTFKGPVTIVSGTQPYTCLNERNLAIIGNTVGILTVLDPVDGTKLWTTQQWSNDARRCVWNTRIVEYQIENTARTAKQPKR
jgi:hypothetical protein